MAEYRVDELARAGGTSVRNVRVYQERGLLAPPRKVGRNGVYTEAHLARLRLIRLLLQRGYTFATIGELIGAWSTGQGIADLLGLDDVLSAPWSDERPMRHDLTTLIAALGTVTDDDMRRLRQLGLLDADGEEFTVPSPKLLQAGIQLVEAGIPLLALLDLAETLKSHVDAIAQAYFQLVLTHLGEGERPPAETAEAVARLRPLAIQSTEAMLALALTQESERLVTRRAAQSRRAPRPAEPRSGEGSGGVEVPREAAASSCD